MTKVENCSYGVALYTFTPLHPRALVGTIWKRHVAHRFEHINPETHDMDAANALTMSGATVAVTTLVIGVAVGGLARLLNPTIYPGGAVVAVLLAIIGAWVGGFLIRQLGFEKGGLFVGSVVGALVLLMLFRFYRRRRARGALRSATTA